jgi:hypothetical protein
MGCSGPHSLGKALRGPQVTSDNILTLAIGLCNFGDVGPGTEHRFHCFHTLTCKQHF